MSKTDRHRRLKSLVSKLEKEIGQAEQQGLEYTAQLLKIAVLDLKVRLLGISDEELKWIAEHLEDQVAQAKAARH